LQTQIEKLESDLEEKHEEVHFEHAADVLSDGINTYLNALNAGDPERWQEGKIGAQLRERQFRLTVSESKWSSKLGATLTCYFLLGYHYSLLQLTRTPGYNYPGICIIDFPPTLADGVEVADKENYLVEPFVNLLKSPEMRSCQLIAAGRAFEGLVDVNKVTLTQMWK